jgi:hypothetical protein
MKFRGGEFSTGTTGNFQSELTFSQLDETRNAQSPHDFPILVRWRAGNLPPLNNF